jgi:site-specific recombinase XerD
MSSFAATLQLFFTERLTRQCQASPRTVTAYRDAVRLLLRFVQDQTGKAPSDLEWDDLDARTISMFLDHLETDRHNSARSRNARLAALRSLFRYAALRHPEHAQLIGQVLAIPQKRSERTVVPFLDAAELDALLAAPDLTRWPAFRSWGSRLVGGIAVWAAGMPRITPTGRVTRRWGCRWSAAWVEIQDLPGRLNVEGGE